MKPIRTVQTRCSVRTLLCAILLSAIALAWPTLGFGQWEPEFALELTEPPVALAVDSDGDRLAVASANTVELRDAAGSLLGRFVFGALPEGCCVRDLAFLGDELLIARSPSWEDREGAGGTLGGLYLWSGAEGETPADLPVGGCSLIAIAAASETFATACADAVQLWRLAEAEQPSTVYERPAAAIALDASGTLLAVADRPSDDELAVPNRLRLLDLADASREVASTEIHEADIVQLGFLPDGRVWSLDADGVIFVTVQAGMWSHMVAENGPRMGEAANARLVAVSQDGRFLVADFMGNEAGVLIDIDGGIPVESEAAIPMRGAGLWAFDGSDTLLWSGRPPTFPTAIVRSFGLPPPAEPLKPSPAK